MDEPIIVRQGLYGQTGDQGVCVLIDDRSGWIINADPDSGDTTITIPAGSRWKVATDHFQATDAAENPTGMPHGQALTAIFFKDGKLRPEDNEKVIVFTQHSS